MASASDSFPSFPSLWSDELLASERLLCSICQELFLKPKLLPCTHTFCEPCLKTLVGEPLDYVPVAGGLRPKRFPCPECREEIIVPPSGVAGLKNNIYIADKVEQIRDSVMCSLCSSDTSSQCSQATHFCHDCRFSLCRECLKVHRTEFSFHRTESLANSGGSPLSVNPGSSSGTSVGYPAFLANGSEAVSQEDRITNTCERHKREELRFYCETCSIPICRDCRVTSHYEHKPVIDIEEASERAVYELESDKTELENRIATLSAHHQDLIQKKEHVATTRKDVETLVKSRAQKLILKIVECRDQALERLVQQSQTLEESFDKNILEADTELNELTDALEEVSNCLDNGTDIDKVRMEFKMRNSHLNASFAGGSEETRQKRATQAPLSRGFYLAHHEDDDDELTDTLQTFIGKPLQL